MKKINGKDNNIKSELITSSGKKKKECKLNYFKFVNIILSLFLALSLEKSQIIYNQLYYKNLILKEEIMESQYYKDMEIMKEKYKSDTFLNEYLEKISILSHVYNKDYKHLKENKTNIHISMAFNNRYLYEIIVAIETVLTNNNKDKNFITYHLLCSQDVTELTRSKIKTLMNRYSSNLEIIFYEMGNIFEKLYIKRISHATYFRLLLPVIVNTDRILYLDGDTIVFKDLGEMYQIDFEDNYVLGILDYLTYGIDYLGIQSKKYINAGVILLNLEKIRNDKIYYDIINMTNNKTFLMHQDQTIINYGLYPKIGKLPYKYTIFNFDYESDIDIYVNKLREKVNNSEIYEAKKDPTIVHYALCYPKIWKKNTKFISKITKCRERKDCSCLKSHNLWYSYANKTGFLKEIKKYFRIRRKRQNIF